MDYYKASNELADFYNVDSIISNSDVFKVLKGYKEKYKGTSDEFLEELLNSKYVFNKIEEVDEFKWYHNNACDWKQAIREDYILLAEIPHNERTHKYMNSIICNNKKKFINGLLEVNIGFSVPVLYSLFDLKKCEHDLIIIGYSHKTTNTVSIFQTEEEKRLRDKVLIVTLFNLMRGIEEFVDRRVGIVIGSNHSREFEKEIRNNTNIKLGKIYEVGKPRFLIDEKIVEKKLSELD